MWSRFSHAATAIGVMLVAPLAACDQAPAPLAPPAASFNAAARHGAHQAHDGNVTLDPSVRRQIAALRRLTAPFHRFDRAMAAGWSTQITSCLTSTEGAMGFHYGNAAYIDGTVDSSKPELLLYEPEPNGRLRFVGVEYIVPLTAWTSANPPRLFGRDFMVNSAFGVWALHVWVGRDNPSGIFADWNPKVSCAAAQ